MRRYGQNPVDASYTYQVRTSRTHLSSYPWNQDLFSHINLTRRVIRDRGKNVKYTRYYNEVKQFECSSLWPSRYLIYKRGILATIAIALDAFTKTLGEAPL